MKSKQLLIALTILIIGIEVFAFCGFYVAKADASLFNNTSEVIIVRDDLKTTVTMSSDFEGDIKEFAMVVPVPTVIQKEDIKVVENEVFEYLDAYSAPRLAEYYDPNPCYRRELMKNNAMAMSAVQLEAVEDMARVPEKDKVKIEAQYTVGEYDILVLSSTESLALKDWLIENGYKIPEKAEEVLEPYIKSNLKFFVVKVNIDEKEKLGTDKLRPIQMTYYTKKFMLPIRLGMANAKDHQDMIIYGFSKKGRTEVSNYATMKVATDYNVPEFIRDTFGEFYKTLFNNQWKDHKNNIFLEYSWNLSGSNYVKCDPCSSTPPTYGNLKDAGVDWIKYKSNQGGWGQGADYDGDVYFTRLHVRYDRQNFPQDLELLETPNQENFQARYVLHIAIKEKLDCKEAKEYYKMVHYRREEELGELHTLTGWHRNQFKEYVQEFAHKK